MPSERCVKCIINGGFVAVLTAELELNGRGFADDVRIAAHELRAAAETATDIYRHALAFGVTGMTDKTAHEPWNGCTHATTLLGWVRAPKSIPDDAVQIMNRWRDEILDDLQAFVSGSDVQH